METKVEVKVKVNIPSQPTTPTAHTGVHVHSPNTRIVRRKSRDTSVSSFIPDDHEGEDEGDSEIIELESLTGLITEGESESEGESEGESVSLNNNDGSLTTQYGNEGIGKKMPWKPVLLMYSIIFCDASAMSVPTPVLPRMIVEQFNVDASSEWIGLYMGCLLSAFHLSRALSSSTLGSLSDKIGRRALIIFGLFMSMAVSFSFPLVQSVFVAIALRCLLGLLNCNFALSKAYLADLISPQVRSQVFAFWGVVFAASRALSGSLASLLTDVHMSTGIPYIDDNAFFLAFFTVSSLMLIVLITAACTLPPSHSRNTRSQRVPLSLLQCFKYLRKQKELSHLLVAYWLTSYNNSGVLMGITLVASISVDNGGLGFTTREIGVIFILYGIVGTLFQVTFFRFIKKRFGLRKIFRLATLVLGVFSLYFPSIGPLSVWLFGASSEWHAGKWSLVVIGMLLLGSAIMNAVPLANAMIINLADQQRQGLVNGTADSVSAFMRGISPALQGLLFSIVPAGYAQAWILFSFFFVLYCTASFLSSSVGEKADGHSAHD